MNIPDNCAVETIKAQCQALQSRGYRVTLTLSELYHRQQAVIVVSNIFKAWHLSDPDLQVIVAQLCELSSKIDRFRFKLPF